MEKEGWLLGGRRWQAGRQERERESDRETQKEGKGKYRINPNPDVAAQGSSSDPSWTLRRKGGVREEERGMESGGGGERGRGGVGEWERGRGRGEGGKCHVFLRFEPGIPAGYGGQLSCFLFESG